MGSVTSGIPQTIVGKLAELSKASTFVETGTFRGATTRWASSRFDEVHTIELSPELYAEHHAELQQIDGVHCYQGDSAEVLPTIVAGLTDRPAVFWLDGHWSGGETAGEESECPVMSELECLSGRPHDLILIDDARLFLCAPPAPHRPEQWPTIHEICSCFDLQATFVQVIDDVIFIIPNQKPLRNALIEYARNTQSPTILRPPAFQRLAKRWLGRE